MKKWINIEGSLFDLSRPRIMGIVNATPDSFYGKSRIGNNNDLDVLILQMLESEVDIFDVGGYSTRPGAEEVGEEEEVQRILPVISRIKERAPEKIISVDTFRSSVARAAVKEGASMINDVSGGNLDAAMFKTVAELGVPYVLTHMRGTPQTMNSLTNYTDVTLEVIQELQFKYGTLLKLGVKDVIIDPGFGFAKSVEQSFILLKQLEQFQIFELPILTGLSRKSMIWKTLEIEPENALNGTSVLQTMAVMRGVNILRVHDVAEADELTRLFGRMGLGS